MRDAWLFFVGMGLIIIVAGVWICAPDSPSAKYPTTEMKHKMRCEETGPLLRCESDEAICWIASHSSAVSCVLKEKL